MVNNYKFYNLKKLISEELKNNSNDLVTRETGRRIRGRIEADFEREAGSRILVLDFSGVGIIDYSCADEVIAKIVARLVGGEYGDKYILLKNLLPNQIENIQVALERKKLAVPLKEADGLRILGSLNPYLTDALAEVNKRKSITARDLADLTGAAINLASTKLLNLHKARLVIRTSEGLPERGRQYIYKSLLS